MGGAGNSSNAFPDGSVSESTQNKTDSNEQVDSEGSQLQQVGLSIESEIYNEVSSVSLFVRAHD